jgi:hypothetical protein
MQRVRERARAGEGCSDRRFHRKWARFFLSGMIANWSIRAGAEQTLTLIGDCACDNNP